MLSSTWNPSGYERSSVKTSMLETFGRSYFHFSLRLPRRALNLGGAIRVRGWGPFRTNSISAEYHCHAAGEPKPGRALGRAIWAHLLRGTARHEICKGR